MFLISCCFYAFFLFHCGKNEYDDDEDDALVSECGKKKCMCAVLGVDRTSEVYI